MNGKVETTRSPMVDSLLLLVSVELLIGGIGAYYFYEDMAIAPVRVAGLIAVVIIAAFIAGQSQQGANLFRFLKDADMERRKVVWPTHQETLQTSLIVIVVTIIISLFLAAVDWMLGALVRSLLGGG